MPIKQYLHICCQYCGKRQAEIRGEFVSYSPCNCKRVPGPPSPPRLLRLSEVNIVEQKGGA